MPDTETEMNPVETETETQETEVTGAVGKDIQSALMDMIIADESPSNISDTIKDMLFAKSAEKIDAFRPDVAASTFNSTPEVEAEVETEVEPETTEEE
tara:strand:- start:21 stop:314 length:294 start_codon:yes stop_codon:yes gene_type:complete